jgi:DNA invertase Pin-like site-specific DNA recombinase
MRALAMYAVQYLRASTGLQPCSIDQQSMAIAAYAALRDFEIMDTYSDDAISGLTLSARPALRRLLADALAPDRKFQAILIYDVSRWGRFQDIDQGAHLEFLCRRAGVAVHYCAEPFENDGSPEADLIKQIKRAIAAEYSRDLAQRVSLGKRHTSGRGLLAGGGTPFAMLREVVDDKGRAVVVLGRGQIKVASNYRVRLTAGPADAVETLKQIFRLYVVAGLKLPAIAAQLNDARAPSPSGRGWNVQRLRRILRYEAYVGVHVYGRQRHELGVCVERVPRGLWMRVDNAWPAIVPRWMFDKAQALLSRPRRSDENLLQDLSELLRARGRLDAVTIDFAEGVACANTYIRRFGSLAEAYRRVGYRPGRRP